MIVLDTSLLYALLDTQDDLHRDAIEWYPEYEGELATTPLVITELDHLAAARLGRSAVAAFRKDVASGAYAVEWWPSAMPVTVDFAERHARLRLSLADASLVVLAERLGTTRIATFDERHFRALQPLGGEAAFTLLPADAA